MGRQNQTFAQIADIIDKKIEKKLLYDPNQAWDKFVESVPQLNIPPEKTVKVQIQWLKEAFQRGWQYGNDFGMRWGRQVERHNEWRKLRELRAYTEDDLEELNKKV